MLQCPALQPQSCIYTAQGDLVCKKDLKTQEQKPAK